MISTQKITDLFLFMGQSNMAGRGAACERWQEGAPRLTEGAGYEYRAISSPDCLYPAEEPFGRAENRENGINDGERKSGSMVTAFMNAYYKETGVPVVGISASKGGSSILQWQPAGAFLEDVKNRLSSCRQFLERDGWTVRHTYMLWCQGETDGDHGMSGDEYQKYFLDMWQEMKQEGVKTCFLVLIGNYNGTEEIDYREIQQAQRELTQNNTEIILVDESFPSMKARGLMKDFFHYYQAAYNEVGTNAGRNAGRRAAQQ
ncbi:MAG: hypothetical protein J6B06_07350 [Lachnospiraceae bacterium]|nr:hypothetical protein [Lachnospiraceae bacterium]